MKALFYASVLLMWLCLIGGEAHAQPVKVIIFHATDCTAATAKQGVFCFEQDANTLYMCEPSAGDCDTAGEWIRSPAPAVDLDGDGTSTIAGTSGTSITLDATDDGTPEATLTATYLSLDGLTGTAALKTTAGNNSLPAFTFSVDADTGWYREGANSARLSTGGTDAVGANATEVVFIKIRRDIVQSVTCTSTGTAALGALTITPTASYVEITNSDVDGCDITISETGAAAGRTVELVVVSNAGGTVNFADTAGVTEIAGAFTAGLYDNICLRYTASTWYQNCRNDN